MDHVGSPSVTIDDAGSGVVTGLLPGLRNGHPVSCEGCGDTYYLARLRKRGDQHLCKSCRSKKAVATTNRSFATPDSTKAERVRANGLINKRLKLGHFERPKACMKCGAEKRLDFHHHDYTKQDEGFFLCRSCHVKAHHNPETLTGIEPVRAARVADRGRR